MVYESFLDWRLMLTGLECTQVMCWPEVGRRLGGRKFATVPLCSFLIGKCAANP